MLLLQRVESIYYLFLLIGFIAAFLFFIQSEELIYDPPTIRIYFMAFIIQEMNIIKGKLTTSHFCFQIILISVTEWFKKFLETFICIIINHDWMHYMLFIIIIFKRNKSIVTVNLILHVSDFLRLVMISFKYDLILLRYSSTDSVLFLSPLFCIQYNYYSKNYQLLLVYNNLLPLLHSQKDS